MFFSWPPGLLSPENAEGLIWFAVGLIFGLVGTPILSRQPRHIIGWLLMLLPIMASVSGSSILHQTEKPFVATVPIYLSRRKAPELLGVLRLGKRLHGRGYSGDEIKTLVSFGAKLGQPVYALTLK